MQVLTIVIRFNVETSDIDDTVEQAKNVHGNSVDSETMMITDFFLCDVSYNWKETVAKKKGTQQKWLLTDTMINLHEKLCSENPGNNVSYATFTHNRPFWVRLPSVQDSDTRLSKHENIQLMANQQYQLRVLRSKNCDDIMKDLCCDNDNKDYMFRKCYQC